MSIFAISAQRLEGFLAGGLVVAFYLITLWLFAALSGWRSLAKRYAGRPRPGGKTYRLQSARIGWVTYGGLTISISEAGLRLAVWPLCRFGHPPLLIPWSDIRYVAHRRGMFFDRGELALGAPEICEISLSPRVFHAARARGFV